LGAALLLIVVVPASHATGIPQDHGSIWPQGCALYAENTNYGFAVILPPVVTTIPQHNMYWYAVVHISDRNGYVSFCTDWFERTPIVIGAGTEWKDTATSVQFSGSGCQAAGPPHPNAVFFPAYSTAYGAIAFQN